MSPAAAFLEKLVFSGQAVAAGYSYKGKQLRYKPRNTALQTQDLPVHAEVLGRGMDPRAALLQQESEENGRQRNRSIGMHNLRAKLREQLKGYSHVRGTSSASSESA